MLVGPNLLSPSGQPISHTLISLRLQPLRPSTLRIHGRFPPTLCIHDRFFVGGAWEGGGGLRGFHDSRGLETHPSHR
jgi:hypothetical protein